MRFILDMVHHNPGEARFKTAFTRPDHLASYGFNGQVFKHINCVATFGATGIDCFPAGSPDRRWLDRLTTEISGQIAAAKASGLRVFFHIDLFVLPRRLVEHLRTELCDAATGRILLDRPRTLELHRVLFDELSARFPQVDGYIVRVGETYLFDSPYHVGNGPIPTIGPNWTPTYLYEETLAGREPADPRWGQAQADAYVQLIRFLRAELCVKHGRQLFFRTWDIFPDKLHARLDHYLSVTDAIEPHPKLAFSIKHTALDFWRHVKVNECLTRGRHPQIIEIQCQREYEGKGASPNYVMEAVINGFEENPVKLGLRDLLPNPNVVGVCSWSRGGGWYGPYVTDELWPDLNAYVLAKYVGDSGRNEEDIFRDYARRQLGLQSTDIDRFRQLCLLSAKAVLHGRHCTAFDIALQGSVLPTACWMRDDRLGGRIQLRLVFEYLHERGLLGVALREKAIAVELWEKIQSIAEEIAWPDPARGSFVRVSAGYGRWLFTIVYHGWRLLAAGHVGDRTGNYDRNEMMAAASGYAESWRKYRALAASHSCPTLYQGRYFALPGRPDEPGLDESVRHYERIGSALDDDSESQAAVPVAQLRWKRSRAISPQR